MEQLNWSELLYDNIPWINSPAIDKDLGIEWGEGLQIYIVPRMLVSSSQTDFQIDVPFKPIWYNLLWVNGNYYVSRVYWDKDWSGWYYANPDENWDFFINDNLIIQKPANMTREVQINNDWINLHKTTWSRSFYVSWIIFW